MSSDPNVDHEDAFKRIRNITGWVRPPGSHGCVVTEIIPGLWTAHFRDIDSKSKLINYGNNFKLVVNTAIRQCNATQGSFGDDIEVLMIDLEDDPDERKCFDAGKLSQSRCRNENVPELERCAGDAKKYFKVVSNKIKEVIDNGGSVMVHCHASISRSATFLLAYMIQFGGFSSLITAVTHMKGKWEALWPCDRFLMELIAFEKELSVKTSTSITLSDILKNPTQSDRFVEVRRVTGWIRPPGAHGCQPTEIIKGLWTAHYHDVDTYEKLISATNGSNIKCVINTAIRQCDSKPGAYGDAIDVFLVDLEDDPDERKQFDAGKEVQSKCNLSDVAELHRCAGNAKKYFSSVSAKIHSIISEDGGDVLVHCHASISRSAVFILAYMLEYGGYNKSLPSAVAHMKSKWDATWPCDRFVMDLIELEQNLNNFDTK